MRKPKFVLVLLLIVISLNAQKVIDSSSQNRPIWLKETPNGKFFNSSSKSKKIIIEPMSDEEKLLWATEDDAGYDIPYGIIYSETRKRLPS